MARTEARIKTAIWNNDDFTNLTFGAQWLYELILTQADLSMCGVIGLMPQRWAKKAKGLTAAKVRALLEELAHARFVVVDESTEEVWVRSFTRWDGVIDAPGPAVAMMKDYDGIASKPIRNGLLKGLGEGFLNGLPERFPKWFKEPITERIPKGFLEGFRDVFEDPLWMGSYVRVRACVPPTPTPTPTPTPGGFADPSVNPSTVNVNGTDPTSKADVTTQQSKPDQQPPQLTPPAANLVQRWLTGIDKPASPLRQAEAARIIPQLLDHLDPAILDEIIGACHAEATNPPTSINYLVASARRWADTHGLNSDHWDLR